MVDIERLEEKMQKSGKSKTHLSNALGIAIQTFKKKCTNKNDFKLSEVDVLCDELEITTMTERAEIFLAKK